VLEAVYNLDVSTAVTSLDDTTELIASMTSSVASVLSVSADRISKQKLMAITPSTDAASGRSRSRRAADSAVGFEFELLVSVDAEQSTCTVLFPPYPNTSP
jgi:hypothetical protein